MTEAGLQSAPLTHQDSDGTALQLSEHQTDPGVR